MKPRLCFVLILASVFFACSDDKGNSGKGPQKSSDSQSTYTPDEPDKPDITDGVVDGKCVNSPIGKEEPGE